jgi:mRNA-degrading endonuclease HigB of HigAB toxin-antitoxin module
VIVRYQNGIVMIQKIGTHAEYNKWKLDWTLFNHN